MRLRTLAVTLADIVAFDGHPTADVPALERARFAVKEGAIDVGSRERPVATRGTPAR